jgi:hypothetical protein
VQFRGDRHRHRPHAFSRNDETRISRKPESGKARNPESMILQSGLVSSLVNTDHSLATRRDASESWRLGDDLEHPKPLDPESGKALLGENRKP